MNPPRADEASSSTGAIAEGDPVLAVIDFEPSRVILRPIDFIRYAIYALLIVALGATSGYLVANLGNPVYGARSEVLFERRTENSTGFLREDRNLTTQLVTLRTRAVLGPVASANGLSVDNLAKKLHVGIVESSEILRIQVNDPSKRRAMTLLAAINKEYLSRASSPATSETQAYLSSQLAKVNAELQRLTTRATRVPAEQGLIQAQITSLLDQRTDLNGRLEGVNVDFINRPRVAEITQPYLLSDPVAPKPVNGAVAGGLAGVIIAAVAVAVLARRRGQSVRRT